MIISCSQGENKNPQEKGNNFAKYHFLEKMPCYFPVLLVN